VLGGSSESYISGEKSEDARGNADYWVVKLNADGSKTWDKTLGSTGYDLLTSLQQTKDGGYILAGESSSDQGEDKS
jgi:hypothetical protein